jgi:hypothetical protein
MEEKEAPEVNQPTTVTTKAPAPRTTYNAYTSLHHPSFV